MHRAISSLPEEEKERSVAIRKIKKEAIDFEKHRKLGERVMVKFNIRGNEYNGRHFVNLQMWDCKNMQSNESEGTTSRKTLAETEGMDDLPF